MDSSSIEPFDFLDPWNILRLHKPYQLENIVLLFLAKGDVPLVKI